MKDAEWTKKINGVLCAIVCGAMLCEMQGSSQAEQIFSLDEVTVTAERMPVEVSKSSANVTIITKEEIEQGHYATLGDVLGSATGVIITTKAFPGAAETLRINGDDRVLIMLDGRKISRPEGTANGHANFDLSNVIALDNIERIEIVKGGLSALYGSDAVGGVVNIITKKASENKTMLRTSIGSWGERNYGFTLQGVQKKWSWYVTANKRTQDNIYYRCLTGHDTKVWPNSSYDGENITFRLDNAIDEDRSLTFNFEHMSNKSGQPYSLSLQSTDMASHLWNNVALTYNFNQKSTVPGEARIYANYHSQYFQGIYESRTTGLEYKTGWALNDKHTFIVGSNLEKGEVLEGSGGYSNKDTINTALYVQDIYKLDPKWTLTTGLRYDHYSNFAGQTTPRVSLNYGADADTDIYVSYNKVFRAPNLDDLYYRNDAWFSYGNPNLKPENGRVVTVGVNKRLGNSTTASASYFHSDINDAIAWNYNPVTYISNVVNIANEKKHGCDINLTHRFSSKYYAQIGYSYLYAKRDYDGGYPLYNSEPNGYRFKAGYNDDKWNCMAEMRGASGRSNAFADRSYWIWNASINYRFNKDASMFFKVNNITNRAYELNPDGDPTSIYTVHGDYPMPARNYQFGLKYQL